MPSDTGFPLLYVPGVFAGVDYYNGGTSEATVLVHTPELREVSFTINAGQLQRLRTGWRDASSEVKFEFKNGKGCGLTIWHTGGNEAWHHGLSETSAPRPIAPRESCRRATAHLHVHLSRLALKSL